MSEHKNKIVIVDDDASLAAEFEKILLSIGYEVQVYNSPQFINRFTDDPPDLVLMDVWFNGTSKGLTEVKAIRLQHHLDKVPVILMSSDPRVAEYARKVHADGYLSKPLDPELLIVTLNEVLGQPTAL